MLAGLNAAAAVTQAANQGLQPRWQSRMSQCDEPAECQDWVLSFFCLPCANAIAKTEADRSNVCYNCVCWANPIMTYSYIRHIYSLPGSCGDDCGYGFFCTPCSVRQVYTESRLRKVPMYYQNAGRNIEEWHVSLFDCDCCQFFNALFCAPCVAGRIRGQLQPTAADDCCFNTFCVLPTAVYGQTRHEFGLITDCGPLEDLCIPLFCFPCSLTRAENEIRLQAYRAHQQAAMQKAAAAVSGPGAMGDPYGGRQQKQQGGCCSVQ